MSYIFLDKITTSAHRPLSSTQADPCRGVLRHPVTVPNLDHTGIKTDFTYEGEAVLRPDGSVSDLLRRHIDAVNRSLPPDPRCPVLNASDMGNREKERRRRRAEKVERRREREERRRDEEEGGEGDGDNDVLPATKSSAVTKVISGSPVTKGRKKKPFSNDSLFTALLENQVGGNGDRWDLGEAMMD